MRAVWWRARSAIRRRRLATIGVALTIAIVSATVLTLAAGARRTGAAPAGYTASVGGDVVAQVQQTSGRPRNEEVAALPGVRSVQAMTFVFAGVVGKGIDSERTLAFTGARPLSARLVAGRWAAADDFHEFVGDELFVRHNHVHLGQRLEVLTWTQAQADKGLGFNVKPEGPIFQGRLVGIVDSGSSLEDDYDTIVFSPALLRQKVAVVATLMAVRGTPDLTIARLRDEVDGLDGGQAFDVQPGTVVSSNIRNAVDAQALGTWLMAGALSIAALVALGQLLTRHVRANERDREPLAAIGFTHRQIVLESVVRAAVATTAGLALGIVVAVGASSRFPAGFVRALEPHPGARFDPLVLLLGGAALLAAVLGWVATALVTQRGASRRRRAKAGSDAFARRVPSPAAAVGARFALTGRDGSPSSTAGTFVALAAIMAGIVGSVVFAASLDRLVTQGSRFGSNYTVAIGDNSDATPAGLRRALADAPEVDGLMILTSATARAGSTTIGLVGVERVRGGLAPQVLTGRAPNALDEIALGRVQAHDLHVGIGDTLGLTADGRRRVYRIVGTAVVPSVGGNDGVGQGAILTAAGLHDLQPESTTTMAAVDIRGDDPVGTAARLAKRVSPAPPGASVPGVIINVGRVRRVPGFLAALLAGLVLLALFHTLIVSIQSRRRDLAILRALGADGRWVGRAVHWQTTVLTATPLVLGVPLGLVAGSIAFRAFAGAIGAVPTPALPLLLLAAMVAALFVVANLVAVVPSRQARRVATAALLTAE